MSISYRTGRVCCPSKHPSKTLCPSIAVKYVLQTWVFYSPSFLNADPDCIQPENRTSVSDHLHHSGGSGKVWRVSTTSFYLQSKFQQSNADWTILHLALSTGPVLVSGPVTAEWVQKFFFLKKYQVHVGWLSVYFILEAIFFVFLKRTGSKRSSLGD